MHTRRLVAFLLGVWLGGMLFVAYTTSANMSTTKTILESSPEAPRRLIELSGSQRVATILNYNTAEINRSLTESWEWLQLLIGFGVVCALPFAMRLKWIYLIAAVVMFLIAIAQRALLTPEIIGVGRLLDMAGGTVWTQDELWKERRSLHTLQQLYFSGEVVKAMIGLGLTGALLIFRRKTVYKSRAEQRRAQEKTDRQQEWSGKMDMIDDPD
ncbi:MAG TPA: hypothetical protein VGL53_21885 [Bryobacteraceae bacterium]|jgi:hypothetical protein